MTIGAELRAARARAGLSLAELGAHVGVSAATLSRWETGRGTPTAEALERGASILDVDLRCRLARTSRETGADLAAVGEAPERLDIENWRHYEPLALDPVLTAALESFLELGYHGATVRHVAHAAGMSVPNLYHYYPSKQALLVAIMDRTMAEFRRRCEIARSQGRDASERFRLLVECFALFHTCRRELAFIGASEMRSLHSVERRRIAQIRTDCQRMIDGELLTLDRLGQLRGGGHPEDAGRAVVTMLVGIASWYRADGPRSPGQIAQNYVEFAAALVGLRP